MNEKAAIERLMITSMSKLYFCVIEENSLMIIIVYRHARFMQRRENREVLSMRTLKQKVKLLDAYELLEYEVENLDLYLGETHFNKSYVDKECQVDDSQFSKESQLKPNGTEIICTAVRFKTVIIDSATNSSTVFNEVETQTSIFIGKTIIIPSQKTLDKGCNTPMKVYVDSSVNVDTPDLDLKRRSFHGYDTVRDEEDLLYLAGVHYDTFNFLLERTPKPAADNFKVSHKDRLFLLLMKVKTGLSFSSLSAIFDVHRTTVSSIVIHTLVYLVSATQNLIFWPTKAQVQGTMPKSFYPDYKNTPNIIDCTEFRMQRPHDADDKIFSFSQYKHGYTAKILIGVTPGGYICLKSKVAGGRKSDSQLTIESGLIDYLEEGDVVLADKGFPEFRKLLDESGRSVLMVLPPYLENKTEFSQAETEETYKIARVRIHVERVIQRLKIYKILDEIPTSLFSYTDDIVHLICVLVNFQAPIHADQKNQNEE
ncbi:uncharacterized protein LOC131667004 [Phymastichus coffea]|uniref:uncharacterized protein LOC131667004 n=1 Tax=Phymastichus coffea TaxID=108790 RepID=UPI00273BA18A|nr:uncharacterized protein LOC131667004 [Phymastichus coffea]